MAIVADDDRDGTGGKHAQDFVLKMKPRLVIISDLPLPYWMGTAPIARLGSHAEGVFVVITDAGRRLLIEARDFERGPLLAKSTVSLEDWTGKRRPRRSFENDENVGEQSCYILANQMGRGAVVFGARREGLGLLRN